MINISGITPLRFVATDIPFWSMYEGLKPLTILGHYETFVKKVLEKFDWNYEGIVTEEFMDYGKVYGPGNGTGLVGYLVRNESDVGFAVIPPTAHDLKFLDFTNIVLEEDWKIVTSSKEVFFDSSVFASANIFSSNLWICVGCCFIGFSIFWGVIEQSFSRLLVDSIQTPMFKSILKKSFILFGASLGQELKFPPQSFGWLRPAVLCWVITVFVLNGGFTGCLLSKLTLPPKPNYIEETDDLLRIPNLPIFTVQNTPAEFRLRDSLGKTEQLLWERIKSLGVLVSPNENINYVLEIMKIYQRKQAIFLPDSVVLEATKLTIDCNEFERPMHLSNKEAFKIQTAFPIRKNLENPYAETFKYTAQRLFETGLILQTLWLENWKGRHCFSDGNAFNPEAEALPLNSFIMAFYVFLLGTTVYLTVFILEFCRPSKHILPRRSRRLLKA